VVLLVEEPELDVELELVLAAAVVESAEPLE